MMRSLIGKMCIRDSSNRVYLHPETPDLNACIEANKKHLQVLGKNAINTIRGIVSRNENIRLPVYVSFSGGKDSLVSMDLARASLKQRELKAFFLNTEMCIRDRPGRGVNPRLWVLIFTDVPSSYKNGIENRE